MAVNRVRGVRNTYLFISLMIIISIAATIFTSEGTLWAALPLAPALVITLALAGTAQEAIDEAIDRD